MRKLAGTFPLRSELAKARSALNDLGLRYEVISADPGFAKVGAGALVLDEEAYGALYSRCPNGFTCSGWVDYRPASVAVPAEAPSDYEDDVFGRAAIMVLAPCAADTTKIRLIAHISGDLTAVFPYMSAVMREASYNRNGPTFTFMDGYRMISLYPRRIAVAKAVWRRRGEIEPFEMRERPPALEMFKRLPGTNCQACGEQTCLAFAVKLWSGAGRLSQCGPVFGGGHGHLRPALVEICRGLGVAEALDSDEDIGN